MDEEQIQTCGIRKGNARIVLVQADYPERPLAIIHATDFFSYDKEEEAKLVFNTTDTLHPAVAYLFEESKDWLIGGSISAINLPIYSDFLELRQTPSQVRTYFSQMGWEKIVAFQTRNPMHRAHQELTKRAAAALNAKLLIHPVVGMTKPGDIHYKVRVEAYKVIVQKYPKNLVTLALLPLAMRMGGPREALLHAIIRKNYGCTHFIVGRDHAGPGSDSQGKLFYEAYEAQVNLLTI